MPETKAVFSMQSRRKIEELAREQSRDPRDVLDEAVQRYAASQLLDRLNATFERRAAAMGIREEDIPGLVEEVRRENQTRER